MLANNSVYIVRSLWQVAVVIAFAFSNLRCVVGPCLRKLTYMSHVV